MTELPDDELDKLFRKSSEEFDPTFDPNDWNELKKRLDAEDGIQPRGWWRRLWPVGMVLLFLAGGIGSYFWMKNPETDKLRATPDLSGITDEAKANETNVMPAPEKSVVGNEADSNENKEKTLPVKPTGNEELTKSKAEKILPRSRSKAGGVYLEPNRSDGKGGEGAFSSKDSKAGTAVKKAAVSTRENEGQAVLKNRLSSKSKPENEDESEKQPIVAADKREENSGRVLRKVDKGTGDSNRNDLAEKEKSENVTKKSSKRETLNPDYQEQSAVSAAENQGVDLEKETRLSINAHELAGRPVSWKSLLNLPEVPVILPKAETSEQIKQQEPSPKFAVRFSYAPDLSTVGLKNFSKPGSSFSLLVEYELLRRLYIQSGVVRSAKIYSAKKGEYEWPSDWPATPIPSSTDANCKVIEVPLNLRYDISRSDRSRWFAGGGLSSYYMQNEKYKYNYPPHTYGIKWWDSEAKTGWYWLSHVNVSAGYERRISQKLSLLAEPYVRIPIKRVGYGKVNLFTTGVWISLRYTPVFK